MAFNGSGQYVRLFDWTTDRDAGVKIQADRFDQEMDGMATGLSLCVTRDGQSPATADLPMGSFKHIGVANATARTNYGAVGQVQDGAFIWGSTTGGVADAYTASVSPPITAYAAGQKFAVIVSAANTGASTINFNSLGVKSITKKGATALAAGDLPINAIALLQYDGTQFQLLNVATVQTADIADGGVSTAKLADNGVTLAKLEHGTQGDVLYYGASGAPTRLAKGVAEQILAMNSGATAPEWANRSIVQFQFDLDGVPTSGTAAIPSDDTAPQNTEGTEFQTVAITPKSASSTLLIIHNGLYSSAVGGNMNIAMFKDSDADAIAATTESVSGSGLIVTLIHSRSAGSTSEQTFKVRAGLGAVQTAYFNRMGTTQVFSTTQKSFLGVLELS